MSEAQATPLITHDCAILEDERLCITTRLSIDNPRYACAINLPRSRSID